MGGDGRDAVVLWKKVDYQPINHSCVKVFSYTRSIAGPQFRSAHKVSCNYLKVLGSLTCPCKFLKTLVIYTLKKLASAVQLRPGPPYSQLPFCCSSCRQYGITVILMRFHFDERKSGQLRANPKRGIGFEEAQEVFSHPYYLDQRTDWPEQYRAIGWGGGSSCIPSFSK